MLHKLSEVQNTQNSLHTQAATCRIWNNIIMLLFSVCALILCAYEREYIGAALLMHCESVHVIISDCGLFPFQNYRIQEM